MYTYYLKASFTLKICKKEKKKGIKKVGNINFIYKISEF